MDLGLFRVQKVRDGKVVRNAILKVEIEVYKDLKIETLDKFSPRLREDFYMVLRKKVARASYTARISFNSKKLKKKLIRIARKRLGKDVVHDVLITDQQKAVRNLPKKKQAR